MSKELVEFIVKRLAERPDAVTVDETKDEAGAVYKIVVDEADKGKVIGKQGKVIKAIRAVVGVAAQKAGVRSMVEID